MTATKVFNTYNDEVLSWGNELSGNDRINIIITLVEFIHGKSSEKESVLTEWMIASSEHIRLLHSAQLSLLKNHPDAYYVGHPESFNWHLREALENQTVDNIFDVHKLFPA